MSVLAFNEGIMTGRYITFGSDPVYNHQTMKDGAQIGASSGICVERGKLAA
jgi:hypothetical protein